MSGNDVSSHYSTFFKLSTGLQKLVALYLNADVSEIHITSILNSQNIWYGRKKQRYLRRDLRSCGTLHSVQL